MTNSAPDTISHPGLRKALISIVGPILVLFISAFLFGYTQATLEHRTPSLTDAAMILVATALIAAVLWGSWKLWPAPDHEPVAPRVKKSRNLMYGLMGISLIAGIIFALVEGPDNNPLFSNGPISPTLAIAFLICIVVIVPAVTWLWWRTVDEHEAGAYRDGGFVTLHFYMFLVPSWWLAERAGWVPVQDPMIVFLMVSTVWSLAWFYRKYA